jgi:hypothetical protein
MEEGRGEGMGTRPFLGFHNDFLIHSINQDDDDLCV